MTFSDPALPGLALALDVDAFLERLRHALRQVREDLEVTTARILDVQYQPRASARVLYRVKMRDPRTGRSTRQLLSVHPLREGTGEPEVPPKLLRRYGARPQNVLPEPVLRLLDPRMVLYVFPVDAAMPWLADAVDPGVVRRALERAWAGRRVRVRRVAPRLLGYTPHARATLGYDVWSESKETGVPELRRLVGKMHVSKAPARLFAGAWALWRAAGDRLSLAPPVGYIPSLNLTLQEQVQGTRLTDLAHLRIFGRAVRQAARSLAALHGLDLPLAAWRTAAREAGLVHRWTAVLDALCPEEAGRIERLRARLAAEIETRARVTGPVHGDFHPANVLVHGRRVIVVDLDDLAYGDPLLDVGRFLASLRVSALRVSGGPSALDEAGEAFLAEYLSRAPGDERRARLFEAVSLLMAAAAPFRLQRPGWREAAAMLLEEAESVLARAHAAAPAAGGSPPSPPARRVEDPLRWAADAQYIQAVLDPYIRESYGAELVRCRVVRRARPRGRTGEAERIRYDLRGWRGREPWAASLQGIVWQGGRGRAAGARLEALRKGLASSPDAPLLPRPVAYLKALSLSVWEMPPGARLSTLLDSPAALEVAPRVARALAALHAANVAFDRSRSWDEELRSLRVRVERLSASSPRLGARAERVVRDLERGTRELELELAPALRALNPHHVRVNGERVAFERVEKVALSPPYLDVADFLANLALIGIGRGTSRQAGAVAARFRDAYRAAGASGEDGVASFEAAALLGLACGRAASEPAGTVAERLLDLAEARLAG